MAWKARHPMHANGRSTSLALLAVITLFTATAKAVRITEFTVPTAASEPFGIALGSDGRLWFTECAGNNIGAMTTSGTFTEFPIPYAGSLSEGIASAPIGRLYFARTVGGVASVTINGTFDDTATSGPRSVVAGPDGRVWVTTNSGVYAIENLSNSPVFDSFSTPVAPYGIALGSNGHIWFTELQADKIGWISPEGGAVHEIDVAASSYPNFIVGAPNGDVWFTERDANKIGRRHRASGDLVEYDVPTAASSVQGIAFGPDGDIWFTEYATNKIGRVTVGQSGVTVREYPTAGSPRSIVSGPDGNLYFTEQTGNKIGKLEIFVPGDVDGNGVSNVADVFYLINFLFANGPPPL
jgi:virginiamycin B lyase